MDITQEKLNSTYKLYAELEELEKKSSDAIKDAKLNQDAEATVPADEEGSDAQTVTEKELWEEVRWLGVEKRAGVYLKEKYPEVFELADAANKKAEEINTFIMAEYGLSGKALRLSDVFKIVEAVVEYKLHGGRTETNKKPEASEAVTT